MLRTLPLVVLGATFVVSAISVAGGETASTPTREIAVLKADCEQLTGLRGSQGKNEKQVVLKVSRVGPAGQGLVTVRDGRAYVDGHPLGNEENRRLGEACASTFG